MKLAIAGLLAIVTTACVRQVPPDPHTALLPSGAEPVPSRASLQRYYQVTRVVDSTAKDTVTELVVQANFRNPRVRCSNLVGPPTRLSLTLRKDREPMSTPGALLRVEYQATERLINHGDRSLQLHLNGETLEPVSVSNPTRGMPYTRSEVALYMISSAVLRQIVAADTASASVFGEAGRCEFPITGHARGLIALFMERELAINSVAVWR